MSRTDVYDFEIRRAEADDLPAIVGLLADDPLGATREDFAAPLPGCYTAAFAAIAADPRNELVVAVRGDSVVGCLQLTFIPGLSRRGAERAQIESVRVARRELLMAAPPGISSPQSKVESHHHLAGFQSNIRLAPREGSGDLPEGSAAAGSVAP